MYQTNVTGSFTIIDQHGYPNVGVIRGEIEQNAFRAIIHELFPFEGIDPPGKRFFLATGQDYAKECVN